MNIFYSRGFIQVETEIINRVANSSLVQLDLEEWYPVSTKAAFDLSDYLFEKLILKELEFRKNLKETDWTAYSGKHVALFCSEDAIVPTWAFMLAAHYLRQADARVYFCHPAELDAAIYQTLISTLDTEPWKDQKVIVKGCSRYPVPISAYVAITEKLTPVVQSLMYGEPCSNVPLYKRKANK